MNRELTKAHVKSMGNAELEMLLIERELPLSQHELLLCGEKNPALVFQYRFEQLSAQTLGSLLHRKRNGAKAAIPHIFRKLKAEHRWHCVRENPSLCIKHQGGYLTTEQIKYCALKARGTMLAHGSHLLTEPQLIEAAKDGREGCRYLLNQPEGGKLAANLYPIRDHLLPEIREKIEEVLSKAI